jgi:hypothetical protein
MEKTTKSTTIMIEIDSFISANELSAAGPCGLSTDKSSRPHPARMSPSAAVMGRSRFPACHVFIIDLPRFSRIRRLEYFPVNYNNHY